LIAPGELRAESFARYPPQARSFAVANLPALQRMPLILVALVLRQAIQYDWCFPREREQLSRQLDLVGWMDAASFDALMAPFSAIQLSPELRGIDWVSEPQRFSEQLTAYLWSQHQIDHYHEAAQGHQQYLQKDVGRGDRSHSTLDHGYGWAGHRADGVAIVPASAAPWNVVYECRSFERSGGSTGRDPFACTAVSTRIRAREANRMPGARAYRD
jgi:hypothetical protein